VAAGGKTRKGAKAHTERSPNNRVADLKSADPLAWALETFPADITQQPEGVFGLGSAQAPRKTARDQPETACQRNQDASFAGKWTEVAAKTADQQILVTECGLSNRLEREEQSASRRTSLVMGRAWWSWPGPDFDINAGSLTTVRKAYAVSLCLYWNRTWQAGNLG